MVGHLHWSGKRIWRTHIWLQKPVCTLKSIGNSHSIAIFCEQKIIGQGLNCHEIRCLWKRCGWWQRRSGHKESTKRRPSSPWQSNGAGKRQVLCKPKNEYIDCVKATICGPGFLWCLHVLTAKTALEWKKPDPPAACPRISGWTNASFATKRATVRPMPPRASIALIGGGNWGTLRIPRKDWETLGKIRWTTTTP